MGTYLGDRVYTISVRIVTVQVYRSQVDHAFMVSHALALSAQPIRRTTMNVEQMTNEEIALYLTKHHTGYQKLTYEEWQDLDAEAARRLRNSIPKPMVKKRTANDGDAELYINDRYILFDELHSRVDYLVAEINNALTQGGGDDIR